MGSFVFSLVIHIVMPKETSTQGFVSILMRRRRSFRKKFVEYVEPIVLHAELTGVKGTVLHRLHVPGRTSARKNQVLVYSGSFKNSAFRALAQGPV